MDVAGNILPVLVIECASFFYLAVADHPETPGTQRQRRKYDETLPHWNHFLGRDRRMLWFGHPPYLLEATLREPVKKFLSTSNGKCSSRWKPTNWFSNMMSSPDVPIKKLTPAISPSQENSKTTPARHTARQCHIPCFSPKTAKRFMVRNGQPFDLTCMHT